MSGKSILCIVGGIYHDFWGYARHMMPIIESAGHTWTVTDDLDRLVGLSDEDVDVVLSYTSLSRHRDGLGDTHPQSLSSKQTVALRAWVSGGGGLVAVHSATVSGVPNPEMAALLGGRFVEHPPQFTFMVTPVHQSHPIIEDIDAFTVRDELYIQDVTDDARVHMIAVDRGLAHPMVWTRHEGRGRVVHLAPGHGENVWALAPYQRLTLQAIDWVATYEGGE